jgi:hypothetical protein
MKNLIPFLLLVSNVMLACVHADDATNSESPTPSKFATQPSADSEGCFGAPPHVAALEEESRLASKIASDHPAYLNMALATPIGQADLDAVQQFKFARSAVLCDVTVDAFVKDDGRSVKATSAIFASDSVRGQRDNVMQLDPAIQQPALQAALDATRVPFDPQIPLVTF